MGPDSRTRKIFFAGLLSKRNVQDGEGFFHQNPEQIGSLLQKLGLQKKQVVG
jgi:hypothetical protein